MGGRFLKSLFGKPPKEEFKPCSNKMSSAAGASFKEQGNKFFQSNRLEEAIEYYGKAIAKNNSDPAYFNNRALCYMRQKKWSLAEEDCRRALELDQRNVKANFFLGKTLYHQGHYEEAVIVLTRANEAAQSQKIPYGDEITSFIRMVRRERFRIDEDKRLNQEIELQSYLNDLIERDVDRRVAEFLQEADRNHDSVMDKIEEIKHDAVQKKQELNSLFSQVDERRRVRDLPDYLCGKISFELLKDPVVTPSGITYDRADIKEHLNKVGHFDPITRAPLTADMLIPNLAMKEVLDDFITKNEWALSI